MKILLKILNKENMIEIINIITETLWVIILAAIAVITTSIAYILVNIVFLDQKDSSSSKLENV